MCSGLRRESVCRQILNFITGVQVKIISGTPKETELRVNEESQRMTVCCSDKRCATLARWCQN